MTVHACTHRGGWTARSRGEARCRDCGTVRFTEYAALRPPGLPHAQAPSRRAALAADRAAAQLMSRTGRRRTWWGLSYSAR
ncbi:DUF6255 family natural product biosynthesis protein [Streptomyces sp. NPDC008001]|uniref:DUF6255 family natural product biosynthesis protein n=1 Tax=Streptomyces sp. NPDC008001 TaxID=3364804 RepID=UPI0036EE4106